MNWLITKIASPDINYLNKALARQEQLTKPSGSLGLLEEVATRIAGMQRTEQPCVDKVWVSIFAADHGVAEESVSAFPQIVTAEMVKNFANSGAAVNVLSRFVDASFEVIDVGLANVVDVSGVIVDRAGSGTANFTQKPAMTEAQLQRALNTGKSAVERALQQQAQLFIGGEMGIANTTSASAIAVMLTGLSVKALTGAGTGLDDDKIKHKAKVIRQGIILHQDVLDQPLNVLQYLGGFEIAALVGAYVYSAKQGLPVLVDGFIATVAALVAIEINPEVQQWLLYGHCSEEKGHEIILNHLQAKPLLHLSMRLGEGSGALMAVPLLQMACKLHNEMATFQQADITT